VILGRKLFEQSEFFRNKITPTGIEYFILPDAWQIDAFFSVKHTCG
jgi:hypothetical protein